MPQPLVFFYQYMLRPMIYRSIVAWTGALITFPAPLLDNCHLVSLHHRKNKRTPEHEFLLATLAIQTPTDGIQTRYVRVERRSGGASAFRLLGQGALAVNFISISPEPFPTNGSSSLYDLHFSETNRPSILDFAAMLDTIIFLDANYRLYSSNCYWFAEMVFGGMAYAFRDGQVSEGDKPRRRGTFARVPVLRMSSSMKLWMKCISVFAFEEVPGVDSKVTKRQRLVDDMYAHRRGELYAMTSQAEAESESVRVDADHGPNSPLYLEAVLASILCYCVGLIMSHIAL